MLKLIFLGLKVQIILKKIVLNFNKIFPIINNDRLYNLNFFSEVFLINHLGSNHTKRFSTLYNKYSISKKVNELPYIPNKYCKNSIYIIGDSHSEFYSRNFTLVQKKYNLNFFSVWTGPSLLIDFCKNKKISNDIILKLKKIKKNKNELKVIICFGEIDIRVAFYRFLYLGKNFKNDDELISFYIKNIEEKFKSFHEDLSSIFPEKKIFIYFNEITPPTNNLGLMPKNNIELNNILKKNSFPVLANSEKRAIWHNKLKSALLKSKISKYFLKLPLDSCNSKGLISKNFSDDLHFTNDNFLEKCQINFLREIFKN